MTGIMGMQTNLEPIDRKTIGMGDDIFHVVGDCIIPGMFMSWTQPDKRLIAGDYSRLPHIQYYNGKGEIYLIKDRPKCFEHFMRVNPGELMAARVDY